MDADLRNISLRVVSKNNLYFSRWLSNIKIKDNNKTYLIRVQEKVYLRVNHKRRVTKVVRAKER